MSFPTIRYNSLTAKPMVMQFVLVNLPLIMNEIVPRSLPFAQSTKPKLAKNIGVYCSNTPSHYMLRKMMYLCEESSIQEKMQSPIIQFN